MEAVGESRIINRLTGYFLRVVLVMLLAFSVSFNVNAEDKTYTFNAETDFTVVSGVITAYNGDKNNVTEIAVPQTIGGAAVTGIGEGAFADCIVLETIAIPDSITSIGSQAFARDEDLKYIISYKADEVKDGTLTRSGENAAELPSGITSLSPDAFMTCNSITKFRVKDSNTLLKTYTEAGEAGQNNNDQNEEGGEARDYTEGEFLMSKDGTTIVRYAPGNHVNGDIHIPAGVTTIGAYSFESCDSTNGVVIPNTVVSIGDYGFYGYRGSLIITLEEPSTLTTIGAYAFSHLGIFDIKLPASVITIGDYCFSNIRNIHQLDISGSSITVVPAYAFADNSDLHELTMPATLKEIKGYAFSGSGNLDTVKFLGETLEKIEAHSFEDCRTLHEIEIPEGVTTIEDSTFAGCGNLGKVVLPDTVTTIGDNAFKDCVTIHEMVIPANVTYISENSFEGARTDLIDTSKSDAAQRVIQTANLKKGSSVYIGNLKYKLVSAPNNNKAKVSVAGVKNKKTLKKATVPNSLTYSVGDVTFSFTVTAIADNAFSGCSKLKTVTIGKNVTQIGKKAFYNDKKITKLTINSKKLKKVGKQAFKKTSAKLKVKVPKAKKKKYKSLLKKAGFKGKIS